MVNAMKRHILFLVAGMVCLLFASCGPPPMDGGGQYPPHAGGPPHQMPGNSSVQPATYVTGPSNPQGRMPPPSPLFDAMDLNNDDVITFDEVQNASDSLMSMDRNQDGVLSRMELMSRAGDLKKGQRRGMGGGPQGVHPPHVHPNGQSGQFGPPGPFPPPGAMEGQGPSQ